MNILTWNCKGMGSKTKEEAIRDQIKVEKLYALLIQETNLREEEATSVGKKLWKKKTKTFLSDQEGHSREFCLFGTLPN
jgi:hypothetical protein